MLRHFRYTFSVLLVFFSLFLNLGDSLKCYVCQAFNETVCTIGNPHFRTVNCGLEDTTFFWFCLYKVFKNNVTEREFYSYSCERMGRLDTKILQEKFSFSCERKASPAVFPTASKLPHCKPNADEELKKCRVCFTDLCPLWDDDSSANLPNCLNLNTSLFIVFVINAFIFS